VDNIAAEMPDPISREFRRVSRETHLGIRSRRASTDWGSGPATESGLIVSA
jgi:Flp pilus assembly protein TadB